MFMIGYDVLMVGSDEKKCLPMRKYIKYIFVNVKMNNHFFILISNKFINALQLHSKKSLPISIFNFDCFITIFKTYTKNILNHYSIFLKELLTQTVVW